MTNPGALATKFLVIDVSIFIGSTGIQDTSPKASESNAHKDKYCVILEVKGSTCAWIRTQDLPCTGRTLKPLGHCSDINR